MEQTPANRPRKTRRVPKLVGFGTIGLVAVLGMFALILWAWGDRLLNGVVKSRVQKRWASANPGQTLQLGRLAYSFRENRLTCDTATLASDAGSLTVSNLVATGILWRELLPPGRDNWEKPLGTATVRVAGVRYLPRDSAYRLMIGPIEASVPNQRVEAEHLDWRPGVADAAFFGRQPYRTTRLRFSLRQLEVSGVDWPALFAGREYRAESISLSGAFLEALLNRDRPSRARSHPPLMVSEALARVGRPLHVSDLTVEQGRIEYSEGRMDVDRVGTLTFGDLHLAARDISNGTNAIYLEGRTSLMDAGLLELQMRIPTGTTNLVVHYSGSLGEMDLTRLNGFLEAAEQLRIRSGSVSEVRYNVRIQEGRAMGRVQAVYEDLRIALLDESGSSDGPWDQVTSMLANALRIRNGRDPDEQGALDSGQVDYVREPDDTFLKAIWRSLRSGILDAIRL